MNLTQVAFPMDISEKEGGRPAQRASHPLFRRTLILSATALGCGLAVAPAQAASVLTGFATTGSQMTGMQVTATFLGGGTQTLSWAATGVTSGGVTGSGWSLNQAGDTFELPWTLTVQPGTTLQSLALNGIPGNTAFDVVFEPELTPDSARGQSFLQLSGPAASSFNYSVPIDISLGDLFGTLTLNWASGLTNSTVTYRADTDSGRLDAPITPVKPVPEPVSALGLVAAIGGVLVLRRDRQA